MPRSAWLLLTIGTERKHVGNVGYDDDLARSYRYDSFVQNSRRIAPGDIVVIRDREAMRGVAVVEDVVSRAATKPLLRCPSCATTKIERRKTLAFKYRCLRRHAFDEPVTETRECTAFEARYGGSFRAAPGVLSLPELRALCTKYAAQLSIQRMDPTELARALDARGFGLAIADTRLRGIGSDYRIADELAASDDRDPFIVDPHVVERGNRGHAMTQNALAAFLREHGIDPRSPGRGEPDYDLAWALERGVAVAEVKSITDANEERQLRLGLGQVLRYRHLLRAPDPHVIAVLAVEREPRDPSWTALCEDVGVVLVWPGSFERLVSRNLGGGREDGT